jgi:cell division cycle protein 20 (cofactor of APC complex)
MSKLFDKLNGNNSDRFISGSSEIKKKITKFNFVNNNTISHYRRNYNQLLSEKLLSFPKKKYIKINEKKYNKIHKNLDAPNIIDDYYTNILDWGQNNLISIALANKIFIYDYNTEITHKLSECNTNYTSLSWIPNSSYLAIATNGYIEIWDYNVKKIILNIHSHYTTNIDYRIGTLSNNDKILTSGGGDGIMNNYDIRVPNIISSLHTHKGEICGLKWDHSGTKLISGGNDNKLFIWDPKNFKGQHINAHKGAIKALSWCPWQKNIFASGGGSNDRCIKIWNSNNGEMIKFVETDSQVCALEWNPYKKELLSGHGFTKNQLCLWEYSLMSKITEYSGHTDRILYMTKSPDGSIVATASPDETLRFWKVFGDLPKSLNSIGLMNIYHTNIR